jgi:ferric-dicitrate binding protein FerR (iron transport regulator)
MPEIMLKIPAELTSSHVEDLQAELKPYAKVQRQATASFDFATVALIVAFSANALQIADILASWLKRTPKGNQAEIRLSDGRTLKMEANTDPDDFVKQLKAALKDL